MLVLSHRNGFYALLLAAAGLSGAAQASGVRSIAEWVSCSSTADESAGAIKAFASAANDAFTLIVDCPVRLHSGLAIDRAIFIDNHTTVKFTGAGKFIVDNLFHPAFVVANSTNITLLDWNVVWEGTVPVNPNVGGYELDGKFVRGGGSLQPAGAFNDITLADWLKEHRGIVFKRAPGYVNPIWVGAVNASAVFYITGNSNHVVFSGMSLTVPPSAGGQGFMPMAFSLSENWISRQTLTGETPRTAKYVSVPYELTFSDITLDGTLMGWQGSVQSSLFENITSKRYGDLQDANGNNVGGIGKWFPPPHLFYLNHTLSDDPKLYNSNLHFETVKDLGPRVGVARDRSRSDSVSGYALSLKLGCSYCSVNEYTSLRPDGFMDLLPSENITVSNVVATFDSEFIHNLFPAGLRFPGVGYTNVTFDNVQMTDIAATTFSGIIGNAPSATNDGIFFKNFHVDMQRWGESDMPLPTIGGKTNIVTVAFSMSAQSMQVTQQIYRELSTELQESPLNVHAGAATVRLTWSSRGADKCSARGAWSGLVGLRGSQIVKAAAAKEYDFGLICQNSTASLPASLTVLGE